MRRFASLAVLGTCLLAGLTTPARAQVDFTFSSATLTGEQNGSPLLFKILLTNGAAQSSIVSLNVAFDNGTLSSGLIDTTPFDTALNNGDIPDPLPVSYSSASDIDFFNVRLTGVDPGTYNGKATIFYTTDGTTTDEVSRPFAVNVNAASSVAAPEPGTLALFALAGGTGGLVLTRRRRAR